MPLPPRPFLYPVLDMRLLAPQSLAPTIRVLVHGGCRLLQLRVKHGPDQRFLELAREAVDAARELGALLIVNDRPDVALLAGADGVHLGQEDLPPRDARRVLPAGALVGVSTHNLVELEEAEREPVDYVAVGPVYATTSKERPDPVVGVELVRRARRLTAKPLVAIGGITAARAREVVEAGADGLAVISALLGERDLDAATRGFQVALASAQ